MAHISRQELKSDDFVSGMDAAYEYFLQHRDRVIALGVLALALIAGGWGGWLWWNHHSRVADQMLATALDTLHSPLLNSGTPAGTPQFASVNTRANAAAQQFQAVVDGFGATEAGQWARYYLGLAQVDENNPGAAEKTLTAASHSRRSDVAATATNALANFYIRQGNAAAARALLLRLADQNSPLVPQSVVWTELAALDQDTNPTEAAVYYKKLQAAYPNSPTATQAAQALDSLKH